MNKIAYMILSHGVSANLRYYRRTINWRYYTPYIYVAAMTFSAAPIIQSCYDLTLRSQDDRPSGARQTGKKDVPPQARGLPESEAAEHGTSYPRVCSRCSRVSQGTSEQGELREPPSSIYTTVIT